MRIHLTNIGIKSRKWEFIQQTLRSLPKEMGYLNSNHGDKTNMTEPNALHLLMTRCGDSKSHFFPWFVCFVCWWNNTFLDRFWSIPLSFSYEKPYGFPNQIRICPKKQGFTGDSTWNQPDWRYPTRTWFHREEDQPLPIQQAGVQIRVDSMSIKMVHWCI